MGSAFGQLSRGGVLAMDEEKRVTAGDLSEKALARVSSFRSLINRLEREGKVGQDELSGSERLIGKIMTRLNVNRQQGAAKSQVGP